jgi:hypothetical protein
MAKRNASKQSKKAPKKSKRAAGKAQSCTGKQTPAFRSFCTEQRAHRQTELNSMSTAEQMKGLKSEWQNLSAKEKQAYKIKAPVNASHNAHDKKESSSQSHTKTADPHHSTAAKPKRKTKRQAPAKGAAKKKSHAKKTKRAGRKTASKKAAHHEEPEIVNNSYE